MKWRQIASQTFDLTTGGAPNKVLKAEELAEACALSVATVRRAELRESETSLTMANDLAIRRALESAGVEFIDENGGGPGVRLGTGRGNNDSWCGLRGRTRGPAWRRSDFHTLRRDIQSASNSRSSSF